MYLRLLSFLVLGIATAGARAENATVSTDAPGATVASIHAWVRQHNPTLQAFSLDTAAATEAALAAGALPDPSFAVELREIDIDRPRLLPGQVGFTRYLVRQKFPLWGKRELAGEQARAQTDAFDARYAAASLQLLARADRAYVNYWQAQTAAEVLDRILQRLGDIRALAQTRYASGLAQQQDALQAEVEITRVRGELIRRQAAGQAAAAQLNAALGRPPLAPLTEPSGIPDLPIELSLEQLLASRVGRHPAVLTEIALTQAAEQARELARLDRYPDLKVGLGMIQDGDRLRAWELMFEIDIPLQRSALQQRERAAVLRRDAAEARRDAAENDIRGELAAGHARWTGARAQRQLIESTLLIEAEAAFVSALASYGNNAIDFGTLLQALKQSLAAELDRVDAVEAELLAAADLRALTGEYR